VSDVEENAPVWFSFTNMNTVCFLSAMHAAAQMDIGQATDTPIETREPLLYQTVCGAERAGN
jgi:hypothetical protein